MRGEKTDITQKGFTQAAGGIPDLTEPTRVTSLTVTRSIDPPPRPRRPSTNMGELYEWLSQKKTKFHFLCTGFLL